jgi:hypothetical protein
MATEQNDRIRIEYLPLSRVLRWPRNPKGHSHAEIAKSFGRFGFVNPIVLDEKSNQLVAGHGRLETLQAAKLAGKKPPDRIAINAQGEWLVPVIRGIEFANEHEAEAYLLADNQLTVLGGWDDRALAEMLTEHVHSSTGLEATGFNQKDLDNLLKEIGDALGASDGEASAADGAQFKEQWMVVAECKDENDQVDLLMKLKEMGYKVRALVS